VASAKPGAAEADDDDDAADEDGLYDESDDEEPDWLCEAAGDMERDSTRDDAADDASAPLVPQKEPVWLKSAFAGLDM
jgi:hypothetical protein